MAYDRVLLSRCGKRGFCASRRKTPAGRARLLGREPGRMKPRTPMLLRLLCECDPQRVQLASWRSFGRLWRGPREERAASEQAGWPPLPAVGDTLKQSGGRPPSEPLAEADTPAGSRELVPIAHQCGQVRNHGARRNLSARPTVASPQSRTATGPVTVSKKKHDDLARDGSRVVVESMGPRQRAPDQGGSRPLLGDLDAHMGALGRALDIGESRRKRTACLGPAVQLQVRGGKSSEGDQPRARRDLERIAEAREDAEAPARGLPVR